MGEMIADQRVRKEMKKDAGLKRVALGSRKFVILPLWCLLACGFLSCVVLVLCSRSRARARGARCLGRQTNRRL